MMKVFVNKKIYMLFRRMGLIIMTFIAISIALLSLRVEHAAVYIFIAALCMSILILIFMYRYFKEENAVLEDASEQINDYILGNQNARIECDEEGELYRLFNGVNTLVSMLSAHIENEGRQKQFLKNTISDISHQLKTPLAALNIYNGILQEETEDSQAIKEFTQLSEQELERIEVLVQSLLKITKLDAGTVMLEKAQENISELIGTIETQFSYRAKQEEKKLLLIGEDDVTLLCDGTWLSEAIGNIVKNALDHTGKGDTIQIEWRQFASVVQIVVRDNGSGIHPEDIYHIFKRFYRSRFSKDKQGLGLGLPLAKAIIEAHSGTIEVQSEPGMGTAFTINLLIPTKL